MEFCSADIETIASAVPSLAVLVLVACDVSESLEILKFLVLTYSPDPDSRRELDRLGIAWRVGVEPLFPSVRGWFDSINFS